jgi:glyoxylate reductase
MKPRVLVLHKILPEALDYLDRHADVEIGTDAELLPKSDLIRRLADKDGLLPLLVDIIDRDVIDAAPRLKIIANCAVGYNNIDVAYARSRGILVTNTPGVLTEATAELTWALILAAARRIPQADRFIREGSFKGWAIDLFLGKGLAGKRLGLIGMGRIGRAVARRASAFRMDVVYTDPHPLSTDEETASGASHRNLEDLLQSSDVVSLHVSLNPETRGLLSRERIGLMKRGAILINTSRGETVDEAALVDALKTGHLGAAGLDVYEREPDIHPGLFALDNVVLLPHIGSATYETRLNMSLTAARNLVQGLRGERPDNLVEP